MYLKVASFIFTSFVFVNGFAQASDTTITSDDTRKFTSEFEIYDAKIEKEWLEFTNTATGHLDQVPDAVEAWIQPENKKESCKVWVVTSRKDGEIPWYKKSGNHLYWDGNCLNGHAYGIGREFSVKNGELESFLADYDKDKIPPKYYATTNYDRQLFEFKVDSYPRHVSLTYKVNTNTSDKGIDVNYRVLNLSDSRVYRRDEQIGKDEFRRSMTLPNGSGYLVDQSINPMSTYEIHYTVDKNREKKGYAVLNQDNGIMRQTTYWVELPSQKRVQTKLPENYINYLMDVNAKITSNLYAGETQIQEAFVVINKYKRRICQGNIRVNFMDSGIYGRICLENGELGAFSEIMANQLTQQRQRHDQTRAEIMRKKEAIDRQQIAQSMERSNNAAALAQREAAQRDALARQQAAQSAERSNNWNILAQSLQNLSSSVQASNQRSADYLRSNINENPSSKVNFGNSDSVKTNCILISNFVQCRTK